MSPFLAITLIFFKSFHSVSAVGFDIPVLGNACLESNVCGRGTCVVANNTNFGFECQCEPGWRQANSSSQYNLGFLPCVIPNCTIDYSCANAAPPAPGNPFQANLSFFDPCFWINCGGGMCNKTSMFTSSCLCEEGYNNLFNSSTFPCYQQCSIGADCPNLGLNLTNPTSDGQDSSTTSADDDSSSSSPRFIPRVEVAWFFTVLTTFAMFALKNTLTM